MANRDELIKYINECFGCEFRAKAKRIDSYVNGVQIKGSAEVKKVALGVSVSLEFLKRCRKYGADFIIAHHGMGLDGLDHYVNSVLKERFRELIDGEMSLLGFHYMLDAHPEFGNNAQIMKKAGAAIVSPFLDEWGYIGEFPKALPLESVIRKLSGVFNSKPILFSNGPKQIKRIGVVSGGGAPKITDMGEFIESGIELYVTGEAKEGTPGLAKEIKINYAAFGHYNTEKFGVMALGDLIKEKYPEIEVRFVDVPCDL
ncbi:MAG: Nif3-like dinuclear metal center hexameric protein [bacterium]